MQASDECEAPPRRMATPRIWSMCAGLLGVQVVWALQNANTSRILQTLGAELDELAILWIAGPITGLLVQPVIGYLSDRTRGRLGKRRPYILAGALLTALAMVAMPNASSLTAAALTLWLLTASVNIAMEPFRALVADQLPPGKRAAGFAVQVFFIGTGAVLASAMPWMLANWMGVSAHAPPGALPDTVRLSFYSGAAALLLAVGWSVITTPERVNDWVAPERPPPALRRGRQLGRRAALWSAAGLALAVVAAITGLARESFVIAVVLLAFGLLQGAAVGLRRRGSASIGVLTIVEDIADMPPILRRLAFVQFFTWFALFALWVYAVPVVAARQFGASQPGSAAYGASADWVGVLFAIYNGISALLALALPLAIERVGRRTTYALCLAAGAAGLLGFTLAPTPAMLLLPAVGLGCAWAAILSLPYGILADATEPEKMGVYMGIHNIFLVLPQLVAASTLGALLRFFGGDAGNMFLLASASMLVAALLALQLPTHNRLNMQHCITR